MNKIPCTVGILTKNNGRTIRRALESIKDFTDIVICDGGSTDDTVSIAHAAGARVIEQDKNYLDAQGRIADFSAVRNQMYRTAKEPWFIYLDSDEYLSPELIESIRSAVVSSAPGAFYVLRRYIWKGNEVTCATTYPNISVRLVERSVSPGFIKKVHERFNLQENIIPRPLVGALFVPLGDGQGPNRSKGDYYIQLHINGLLESGRPFLLVFWHALWWHVVVSVKYLLRYIYNLVACRGTHMPVAFEFERHMYHFRLILSLWRARHRFNT